MRSKPSGSSMVLICACFAKALCDIRAAFWHDTFKASPEETEIVWVRCHEFENLDTRKADGLVVLAVHLHCLWVNSRDGMRRFELDEFLSHKFLGT